MKEEGPSGMNSATTWLACTALKGMFPDELAILIPTAEGRKLSLFVSFDSTWVRLLKGSVEDLNGEEVEAQIKVSVLESNDRFGLIQLPAQPMDGSRVTKVERQLLSA